MPIFGGMMVYKINGTKGLPQNKIANFGVRWEDNLSKTYQFIL